jgi:DNA-binding NtrC family response regulator
MSIDFEAIGPTVLCVDDDHAVLRSLQRLLHRAGWRVLLADNGQDALDVLSQESIEVLICDEAMPGMCGTAVFQSAKLLAPGTPRILLTAHCGNQAVVMRAVNGGEVFRLLAKPWDDEELQRAATEALGAAPDAWRKARQRAAERLSAFGAAGGVTRCGRSAAAK